MREIIIASTRDCHQYGEHCKTNAQISSVHVQGVSNSQDEIDLESLSSKEEIDDLPCFFSDLIHTSSSYLKEITIVGTQNGMIIPADILGTLLDTRRVRLERVSLENVIVSSLKTFDLSDVGMILSQNDSLRDLKLQVQQPVLLKLIGQLQSNKSLERLCISGSFSRYHSNDDIFLDSSQISDSIQEFLNGCAKNLKILEFEDFCFGGSLSWKLFDAFQLADGIHRIKFVNCHRSILQEDVLRFPFMNAYFMSVMTDHFEEGVLQLQKSYLNNLTIETVEFVPEIPSFMLEIPFEKICNRNKDIRNCMKDLKLLPNVFSFLWNYESGKNLVFRKLIENPL